MILLLAMACVLVREVPEAKISDRDLLRGLQLAIDSTKALNKASQWSKYQFIYKCEKESNRTTVYVQSIVTLSAFKFQGSPSSYSRIGDHLVFNIETMREKEFASGGLRSQFSNYLIDDLNDDESVNTETLIGNKQVNSFKSVCIVVIIENGNFISFKSICYFPGKSLKTLGLKYTKEADLVYSDGVYHFCSLDNNRELPFAYDLMESIVKESGVVLDSISGSTILFTISKNGLISNILIRSNKRINPEEKEKLERVATFLPKWNAGTVRGVGVAYRYSIEL